MDMALAYDAMFRRFFPCVWKRRQDEAAGRRDKERTATMNTLQLDALVEQGLIGKAGGRLIAELQSAVRSAQEKDLFSDYTLDERDPLVVHAKLTGAKPHCWTAYHSFNLRYFEERADFRQRLYREVATTMVFHATAENKASIYKSTQTDFASSDFEPELTLLKIFDRFEGICV